MIENEEFTKHLVPIGETGSTYAQIKEISVLYKHYPSGFTLPNGVELHERLVFTSNCKKDFQLDLYGNTIEEAEMRLRVTLICMLQLHEVFHQDDLLDQIKEEFSQYFINTQNN